MVEGLSHITLVVSDLDKTEEMLTTVLDATKIYDSGDKTFSLSKERFFDIGGIWVAHHGRRTTLLTKPCNHIAFQNRPL